ncbi:MAG TPA: SRPBCC family protein [Candidatus Limnocylindrales bacterium]|nr:SRPBCC family protein [Candidatus Limnocylindrales bacterium]
MKHHARLFVIAAALVSVATFSGCDAISGYFRAKNAAVKWEGPIEEIAAADIKKDGKVFTIHMESRIDAPPDKVWAAMKHPELLSKNSEQYKKSDILKDEGNHKELELHVMALDNLQQLTVAMDFDDAAKTLKIKTLTSTIADIEGTYTLTGSPDGTKSLYTYDAKQTDKIALPISEDVQRSAIKESFVNQVRAIKKQTS